jgi:hypothetical protein
MQKVVVLRELQRAITYTTKMSKQVTQSHVRDAVHMYLVNWSAMLTLSIYERTSRLICRKTLLQLTLSLTARITRNSRSSSSCALLKQETYGSISILIRSIVHSKSLRSLFGQHLSLTLTDLH